MSCSFYNRETCKNKLTLYSFRHTKATILRLKGWSNEDVADMFATSPKMIGMIYDRSTLVGRFHSRLVRNLPIETNESRMSDKIILGQSA